MQTPKVSIFLPTFARYREGYLQRAIDSALAQSWENIELLVIDDGSIDGTAGYVSQLETIDPRVKHIRLEKNTGLPAYALATAYAHATGDYFAWLFDDCELQPDHIETLVGLHLGQPHLGMVYGRARAQLIDGHSFSIGEPIDIEAMKEGSNSIPNVCVLLPRSTIDKVGWYDPHVILKRFCDWDLWLRIAAEFEIGYIDRMLATEYGVGLPGSLGRLHQENMNLARQYSRTSRNQRLAPASLTLEDGYRQDLGIDLDVAGQTALESAFFEHHMLRIDIEGATASAARLRKLGVLDAAVERLSVQQGHIKGDAAENLFVATVDYMQKRLSGYARSMIDMEVSARDALLAADERLENLSIAQQELVASHVQLEESSKTILDLQERVELLVKAANNTAINVFNEQQARELAETKYSLFVFRDAADRRLEMVHALEARLEQMTTVQEKGKATSLQPGHSSGGIRKQARSGAKKSKTR